MRSIEYLDKNSIFILVGLIGLLFGSFLMNNSVTTLEGGVKQFNFSPDGSMICVISGIYNSGDQFSDLSIFNSVNGGLIRRFTFDKALDECKWDPTGQILLVSRSASTYDILSDNTFEGGFYLYSDLNIEPEFIPTNANMIDWDPTGEFILISHSENGNSNQEDNVWNNNQSVSIYDKSGNLLFHHDLPGRIIDVSWGSKNEIACLLEDGVVIINVFNGDIIFTSSYQFANLIQLKIEWNPSNQYLLVNSVSFDVVIDVKGNTSYQFNSDIRMDDLEWSSDGLILSFRYSLAESTWGVFELEEILKSDYLTNYYLYPKSYQNGDIDGTVQNYHVIWDLDGKKIAYYSILEKPEIEGGSTPTIPDIVVIENNIADGIYQGKLIIDDDPLYVRYGNGFKIGKLIIIFDVLLIMIGVTMKFGIHKYVGNRFRKKDR